MDNYIKTVFLSNIIYTQLFLIGVCICCILGSQVHSKLGNIFDSNCPKEPECVELLLNIVFVYLITALKKYDRQKNLHNIYKRYINASDTFIIIITYNKGYETLSTKVRAF